MLKPRLNLKIYLFVCLFAAVFVSSCKEEVVLDGNSALNNGALLELTYSDSFELKAYSELEHSDINSKNITVSTFGSLTDDRTGTVKNSVYFDLVPSLINFSLGNNPVVDSVVLNVKINSLYGPNTVSQMVSVYRMEEQIDESAEVIYYSEDVFTIASQIGQKTGVFSYEEGANEVLSIPLSSNFSNELLNQFGTSTMESDSNFKAYLNGLYLTSESNTGDALLVLNFLADESALSFYYSNDDTTGFVFNFDIEQRVNRYETDISGSEAEALLNDNSLTDTIIYLSPFGDFRTIIELPDLAVLEDKSIHSASLSFKQYDYQTPIAVEFPEPNSLFLYLLESNDSLTLLEDVSFNEVFPFGGFVEETTENGVTTNQYQFTITRYLQQLLQGEVNNKKLCLTYFTGNRHLPGSVKLGGATNSNLGVTLEIIYSTNE